MKNLLIKILIFFIVTISNLDAKEYVFNNSVKKFIDTLSKKHSLNKHELNKLFSNVTLQKSSLKYYTAKKKKDFESLVTHGSWDIYESRVLSKRRISLGVDFIKRNDKALKKAYKKYGVEPHYITAVVGIESFYGEYIGNYPVFDTLVTLSFEKNRRNKFFKNELEDFLVWSYKNGINPKKVYGSFAGAIGLAQFMPSNFETLAVDFNKDGKVDLFNESDAIGSIANYFKKSGWQKRLTVATRVSYQGKRFNRFETGFRYKYKRSTLKGIKPKDKSFKYKKKVHLIKLDRKKYDELWYGTKNFYVITRYNRSSYYAMAVHLLAQKIKQAYKDNKI